MKAAAPDPSTLPPVEEEGEPVDELEPTISMEALNPWLSITIRPREAISYVLKTGIGDNWILVCTIVYFASIPPSLLSMSLQPQSSLSLPAVLLPSGIPVISSPGMGIVFGIVIAYPLSLVFVWASAWLYGVIGLLYGGIGTTAQVRTAISWASVPYAYIQFVASVLAFFVALYHRTVAPITSEVRLELLIFMAILNFPLSIYIMAVYCKAIGAAHHFSAWRGLRTAAFGSIILLIAMILLVTFLIRLTNAIAPGA